MTINEVIAQVDRTRDNLVPNDAKIRWLARTDQMIFDQIMKGREGVEDKKPPEYGEDDGEVTLLVPPPYDELYIYKLEAEIYYEQREIKKYASSMALYNQTLAEFRNRYAQEHRALPLPRVKYW